MTTTSASLTPQYEPDESPPRLEALGLGIQSALLVVAPIALFPIVLINAVDGSDASVAWAVFAMLVVNGAVTILQSFRIGPIGSGMLVIPYPSPTAIPFCIIALEEGGAATLAALIVTSSLFQLVLSLRMSLIRRLVTPAMSGAILILLIITMIPVLFNMPERRAGRRAGRGRGDLHPGHLCAHRWPAAQGFRGRGEFGHPSLG